MAPSTLMGGNVKYPSSTILKSASPALSMDRTSALIEVPIGEIKYGPRIGATNNPAAIINVTDNHQVLLYNGKRIVEVGSRTPLDDVIVSFSAPVVGHDGLLYFQASTDAGLELMVSNGPALMTILARDDLVDDSVLKSFFHGFMPDQVDSSGRIVFTGDFEDGSTSIVIGIPI